MSPTLPYCIVRHPRVIAVICFIKFPNTLEPFIIYLFAYESDNSTFIKFRMFALGDVLLMLDKCSLIKKANMFYGFSNARPDRNKLFAELKGNCESLIHE